MTYANDCIEESKRGLKPIKRHTHEELEEAIERAVRKHGEDFWILLHAIDAYTERRKRSFRRRSTSGPVDFADPWGKS